MTHSQKLNGILHVLIGNLGKTEVNPKLTFEFICKNVVEVNEKWEMLFLQNMLVNDGYVLSFGGLNELPNLTHAGIKFIQNGGYNEIVESRELDKRIKGSSKN